MINGLPERLRYLREKFYYSQKSVADLLHVSPSLISAYETGERTPSVETLLQLSSLYKCSTDYLLGKDLNNSEIILSLADLSDHQIQIIASLVDEFRQKNK